EPMTANSQADRLDARVARRRDEEQVPLLVGELRQLRSQGLQGQPSLDGARGVMPSRDVRRRAGTDPSLPANGVDVEVDRHPATPAEEVIVRPEPTRIAQGPDGDFL